MPIGDESTFSAVTDALWATLEDVGPTQGQNLRDWREEQSSGTGGGGRNFRSGEIPESPDEELAADDLPALFLLDDDLQTTEDVMPGGVQVLTWPIQLAGYVQETQDTYTGLKKARKFAELAAKAILLGKATCFGLSSATVRGVRFVGLSFGASDAEELRASFTLELAIEVQLTS